MRPWRPIAVLLAIAAVAAFAGCGGDDEGAPIPSATANSLNAELDNVQARLDQGSAGACEDILTGPRGPNRDKVQSLIDSLPDDVDPDVRSALQDSFDRLWDLVEQDCDDKAQREKAQQDQEPEPEPEEPTDRQTETNTETETPTTPTDTGTDTTPTSPDEAPLPNDGDGDSGGGVPGAGNDGGGAGGVIGQGDGE